MKLDSDITDRLAEWISDNQRRQGTLEILFRRLVAEVEALDPGVRDRVFAPVAPTPGMKPGSLDTFNSLIHELSGDDL